MSNLIDLFPEDHFGEVKEKVLKEILNGESVGIYGMPGIGMQFFLLLLKRELMEREFSKNIHIFKGGVIKDDPINTVKRVILQSTNSKSDNFETALTEVNSESKCVMMFDSLQYVQEEKKHELLDFLDSVRKTSPGNIIIVVGLDHSMLTNVFGKLKRHSCVITSMFRLNLFDLEGTKRVVEINNKAFKWSIPLHLSSDIYKLTGGNPRLIKYLCRVIDSHGMQILDSIEELVKLDILSLKLEPFTKLCFTLNLEELKMLGILDEKGKMFSPLVEAYSRNYVYSENEDSFLGLSEREKRLLTVLYLNRGRVVDRDMLDHIMNMTGDNYSLWSSYKAIDRLRSKVSEFFDIKTVREKGYILTEVDSKYLGRVFGESSQTFLA